MFLSLRRALFPKEEQKFFQKQYTLYKQEDKDFVLKFEKDPKSWLYSKFSTFMFLSLRRALSSKEEQKLFQKQYTQYKQDDKDFVLNFEKSQKVFGQLSYIPTQNAHNQSVYAEFGDVGSPKNHT